MPYYYDKNIHKSFADFLCESIGCDGFKNICKESTAFESLVSPDFDNILLCPESKRERPYEIDIIKKSNSYYEINKFEIPKKISIKFGCELETCFVINCDEKSRSELDILRQSGLLDNKKLSSGTEWRKLIYFHLKNNIIPYLTPKFLSRFEYAYLFKVYHSSKYDVLLIDLKNGNIVEKGAKVDDYKTLIFEPDGSIHCYQDEVPKREASGDKVPKHDEIRVSCEIVTPVLDSIEDLALLYDGLFGNEKCSHSNSTMGFHVNVSAVDEKNETVKLSQGMLTELVYNWLPYEKKYYKKYRGEDAYYAQKIQGIFNDTEFIKSRIENITTIEDEPVNTSDLYQPYGLGIKTIVDWINYKKFLAITHHKNNNVIEFRMFGANVNKLKDFKHLLTYTTDAMSVFQSSLQNYCKNYIDILVDIQRHNLLYKYIKAPEVFESPKLIEGRNIYTIFWDLKDKYDGKIELGFYDESTFFGFGQKRIYVGQRLENAEDNIVYNKNFKVIVSFADPVSIYKKRFFLYDVTNIKTKVWTETGTIFKNPVEITLEEFSKHTKSFKEFFGGRYYDDED
jgi:hypothetical protein